MRELSHNAFLHNMLGLLIGPTLLQEMARVAARPDTSSRDFWRGLAGALPKISERSMNRSGGKGRPDEQISGVTGGGRRFHAVIEIKVMAPEGGPQLAAYVDSARKQVGETDAGGLLMRIPGRDEIAIHKHPVVCGRDYAACIRTALESCPDLDQDARWLVKDYLRTLASLDDLDDVIVNYGDALWTRSELADWRDTHWSWIHQRVVREIAFRCNVPGWDPEKKNGDLVVQSDPKGSAVDFWPAVPGSMTVGSTESTEPGASFFVKWRQSRGIEVHASVNNYGGDISEKSRQMLNTICSAGQEVMRATWGAGAEFTGRSGRSRMVARLLEKTFDLSKILALLRTELPRISEALSSVVVAFGRR